MPLLVEAGEHWMHDDSPLRVDRRGRPFTQRRGPSKFRRRRYSGGRILNRLVLRHQLDTRCRPRLEDTSLRRDGNGTNVGIEVPSLRVIRSDQVYDSSPTAGKMRYTSYGRDFNAEITVDSRGIVIDYSDLALRPDYNSV